MTNSQAKTIQIFLPNGEPRGIRIAEFTIRTILRFTPMIFINGAPIAVSVRAGAPVTNTVAHDIVEEQSESLTRDRWDVAIDTNDDTVMVPCGAIRERISQELARCIFAALKSTIESPK